MTLPFSHDAFLDVFAAYNRAFWPIVGLLWLASAMLAWRWLRRTTVSSRSLFALLGVHWLWSGIAYHWLFFRQINPAAILFGAGFVLQAGLFTWFALRDRAPAPLAPGRRGMVAAAFVIYALVYPVAGMVFGLMYPRMPVFAVPCPTTLLTVGVLLGLPSPARWLGIIPVLWSVVATSAAFGLGMTADLPLALGATLLALDAVRPAALGLRPAVAR